MSKKEKREEKDLRDYGIIYMSGEINTGTSETICRKIIEYNIKGDVEHIQMIINSPGGSSPAGFVIILFNDYYNSRVHHTNFRLFVRLPSSYPLSVFQTGSFFWTNPAMCCKGE